MKLYWRFALNSLRDFSIFRFDMVIMLIDTAIYVASIWLFWALILKNGSAIGDWESKDLIVLGGFATLWIGVNGLLAGSWQLSQKLLEGGLDRLLCRPVRLFPSVLGECFQVDEFLRGMLIFSASLLAYFSWFDAHFSLIHLFIALLVFALGAATVALIKGCASLVSVWFGEVPVLHHVLFFEDMQIERIPTTVLRGTLGFVLNFTLPGGAIATWPTEILIHPLSPTRICLYGGGATLMFCLWLALFTLMQRAALKRYDAAGG